VQLFSPTDTIGNTLASFMTVKGIKIELDIDIYRAVGSVNKFINGTKESWNN
jgi:hypothetical protein